MMRVQKLSLHSPEIKGQLKQRPIASVFIANVRKPTFCSSVYYNQIRRSVESPLGGRLHASVIILFCTLP